MIYFKISEYFLLFNLVKRWNQPRYQQMNRKGGIFTVQLGSVVKNKEMMILE